MRKLGFLVLGLLAVLCFVGCGTNEQDDIGEEIKSGDVNSVADNTPQLKTNDKYSYVEQNPVVTMEMENGDIVKMELYPKIAPTTVENFISLIEAGFYDGLTFHRVIPNFMAQGGDPSGDGTGGPGYTIYGEFSNNGFKNDISHEVGVVSMARAIDPDSAGSQFFIVTDESSYLSLDGQYAAFGTVIEGMDAVYTIVNTPVIRTEIDEDIMDSAYEISNEMQATGTMTEEQAKILADYYDQTAELDRPVDLPTIKTMTVETYGVDYDEPEKM